MVSKLIRYFHITIVFCYSLLFFLVPLILTPWNYELFEYNKMMLTYGLGVVIVMAWVAKMIVRRRIEVAKTPLDLPIALYLASQVVSTWLSIDPHVSWWGYYSRFHGGLLSTITYILLYYAFTSNFSRNSKLEARNPKQSQMNFSQWSFFRISDFEFRILPFLYVILFSGFLVSLYGIAQHYGFDKHWWIQDVQNRVFSTLGQPNWLAAYLAVLIPLAVGTGCLLLSKRQGTSPQETQSAKLKVQNSSVKLKTSKLRDYCIAVVVFMLGSIYYTALLFTKSRSGFVAIWVCLAIFLAGWLWRKRGYLAIILTFLTLTGFIVITIIFKSPYEPLNRFLPSFNQPTTSSLQPTVNREPVGPALETGGTESWEIRKIVWRGAWDIALHYPLFGSGVETFAFAYYQFRSSQHNLVSEWDFLYNKAHNEYLNYAATTGFIGLGTYLLLIGSFILWSLLKLKAQSSKLKATAQNLKSMQNNHLLTLNSGFALCTLHFALFSGWLSILITNAVGFSVVPIAVFFWLIPAIALVLSGENTLVEIRLPAWTSKRETSTGSELDRSQLVLLTVSVLTASSLLYALVRIWIADTHFAYGLALAKAGRYTEAYPQLHKAVSMNFTEPLYHDEYAGVLAPLSALAWEAKESTLSAELAQTAIQASDHALAISPNNVSFWKSRTRLFHTLSDIDATYLQKSLEAMEKAQVLAPTDPKIVYNKALLLSRLDQRDEAIATLQKAIRLKPNYREPHFALAVFYEDAGEKERAREELQTILTTIAPADEEAKKLLEELGKK